MLQFLPYIFLSSCHLSLVDSATLATPKHVVDIRIYVVLSIDVIIPVLLCQFSSFIVSSRYVTYLALEAFKIDVALADMSRKDRSNEYADKDEEDGYD